MGSMLSQANRKLASQLYAAEVALRKQRGLAASFPLIFILVGISIAYTIGAVSAISYSHSAVFGIGIVIIYAVLTSTLPESPRWLIRKGQHTHAVKVLRLLRQSDLSARREVDEIKKIIEDFPVLTCREQLRELHKKHVYHPLGINLALSFFKYLCGYEVLLFYSSIILDSAAVSNPEATAAYAFASVQLLAAFFSSCIVDHVGRKPLLILGGLGTGIASGLLGTHFYITRPSLCQSAEDMYMNTSTAVIGLDTSFNDTGINTTTEHCNQHFAPIAICSLIFFSLTYALGFRCVIGVAKAEMVPLAVRGLVTSIIDCFGWVLIMVVSGSYHEYENAVRPYIAWWSFAAIGFSSVLFVLVFVPETKGKSLEEIERMFRSRRTCCSIKRRRLKLDIDLRNCNDKQTGHVVVHPEL